MPGYTLTAVFKHSLVARVGAYCANRIDWFAAADPGKAHKLMPYHNIIMSIQSRNICQSDLVNDPSTE
jgi:hypothetical protein